MNTHSQTRVATVILAAGNGTRMKSALPKVLHPVCGRAMIEWPVSVAESLHEEKPVVVVGYGREQVTAHLGDRCRYAVQEELLGTAHAVMQAESLLSGNADVVLVVYGDMPLLRAETLTALQQAFAAERAANPSTAFAMLTIVRDDPQGFGRIVRDTVGSVLRIVEEVDCTPEEKAIREFNPGIYCFDAGWLWQALRKVQMSKKGEYYLTDLVAIARGEGRTVLTLAVDAAETDGINTRVQLAHAEAVMRRRILEAHMLGGVTIADPANTYIDADVTIGQDTLVLPGTFLRGKTQIGANCVIGPHAQIENCTIADGCKVNASVMENARMDAGADIGPFGRLRSGAHLGEGVHMGSFGEVKNSYLAAGAHMGHFSYLGDAQIGAHTNIGAGTITCNYDGVRKSKTIVGEHAFIGSDTMLVAPVTLGDGARTGAGSVVTRDVPAGALVYGVPARSPATKSLLDADARVVDGSVKES